MVLKADDRCHDLRWYRSLSVQTLVLHSPQTFSHMGIHSKMARIWLVFRGNCERTDKLAFLEGKFLNYIFLVIYIPSGAPNENIVQNHLNIALLNVF